MLLALAGGLLWLVLARAAPPTVRTAVARPAGQAADGSSVLDASGYVTARRQATVSAKVTGKVTEVLIEEGQRVEEGAVLARLDDTEAKAQLALSQAQLVAARSQVAEVRAQLEQAERDFDAAAAALRAQGLRRRAQLARGRRCEVRPARAAEREHERRGARAELIAAQSLDAALAQRDMLRARLGGAGRVAGSGRVAEVTPRRPSRPRGPARRARPTCAASRSRWPRKAVAVAQVQLDNTVIRAPFAGWSSPRRPSPAR